MKYSIIGYLNNVVENDAVATTVIDKVNTYDPIWRLNPNYGLNENVSIMTFEIWLENVTDKDSLFTDMKSFVDQQTGITSWHKCTHDEINHQPCVIVENYSR